MSKVDLIQRHLGPTLSFEVFLRHEPNRIHVRLICGEGEGSQIINSEVCTPFLKDLEEWHNGSIGEVLERCIDQALREKAQHFIDCQSEEPGGGNSHTIESDA